MLSAFDKNTTTSMWKQAWCIYNTRHDLGGEASGESGKIGRVRSSSSVPCARPPLLAALAHVKRERESYAGGNVCGPSYAALGQDVRDLASSTVGAFVVVRRRVCGLFISHAVLPVGVTCPCLSNTRRVWSTKCTCK